MATLVRLLRVESAVYERLQQGRSVLLGIVRETLRRAVRGTATVEQAIASVELWLDPTKAPHTMAGAPLSRRAERVLGLLPGSAGYQARRILVDASNSAHGEARSRFAREHDLLLNWAMSPGHKRTDECNDKASRDVGFGPGVYRPGSEPPHPSHNGCVCTLTVIIPDADQRARLTGMRGL